MATLVFSAIGSAVGGPLGGMIGSLIGNQIDRAIIGGGPRREGPRLRERAVTTSSYGTPIPRHFGTMRAAGTIVWSTDLVENSERSGGGKGRPSTTSYSYSVSFAVALASRPIRRLGRIWADGSLLRGAAGDLKAGGALRVYAGHGDQPVDPLIASDRGGACPAFRGLAYCVFESLHLADFGNRIPALTFEIVADDGNVTTAALVEPLGEAIDAGRDLPGLRGFSDEGGAISYSLAALDQVYPLACDAGGGGLTIRAGDGAAAKAPLLPEPAVDPGEDGFGGPAGESRRRLPDARAIPAALRYYDTGRDHQAGLQRADGRARPGRHGVLEFPGALDAATARSLINAAAERTGRSGDTLAWRAAELDPDLVPGTVVQVPGHAGHWQMESWEWRELGVEFALRRVPRGPARATPADAGDALTAPDLVATPTRLAAFELPWDGVGAGDTRQDFAALSSASRGWTGAALYAAAGDELVPLGGSGAQRSALGQTTTALTASSSMRFDRQAAVEVELASADFALDDATVEAMAAGANRAWLGGEVIQFAEAVRLGGATWRLRGLLRGRGGTEALAQAGRAVGTPFVLLDDGPLPIDAARLAAAGAAGLAAIGLADSEPVVAAIADPGITLRPLAPVHPRVRPTASGGLVLRWTRRARGAWAWPDAIETPLNEQAEAYLVGLGDTEQPHLRWELDRPELELTAATLAQLSGEQAGQPLWVRQVGSFAVSPPLLLTLIA